MRIFKRNEGAITVYICFITSIMLILTGVLVDGARARVAEAQVQSAAEAAANSLLAYYNNILKEWFGLMALSENNPSVLEEELMYYLNRTLMTELGAEKKNISDASWDYLKKFLNIENKYENVSFLDMYDYRIDYVKVVPLYNLAENEVLRAQIVEYMKYRAPEMLGEEFLEKINLFRGYKKQAKILSSKLEVDKKLYSISEELGKLSSQIKKVNAFEPAEMKEKLNYIGEKIALKVGMEKVYKEMKKKRMEAEKKLEEHRKTDEYKNEMQRLRKELSLAEDETEKESIRKQIEDLDEPFKSEIEEAEKEEKDAKEEYNFVAKEAKKKIDEIFNELKKYESYNDEAIKIANRIIEKNDDVKKQMESLKKELQGDTSDFAEKMKQEIKKIENQISTENITRLAEKFGNNKTVIGDLTQILKEINLYDINDDSYDLSVFRKDEYFLMLDYIQKRVIKVEELYANYISKYSKVSFEEFPVEEITESKEKAEDPRKAAKDLINSSENPLKNIEAPESHEDFEEIKKGLPSGGAKIDSREILEAFLGEDYDFVVKAIGYDENKAKLDESLEEALNNASIINDMDFEDDSNDSIIKGFGLLTTLIDILEEGLETIRDEIYISEYALGTFNNYLSMKNLKSENGKNISQVDLRLRNRTDRKPYMYFENEIEYIIGGKDNEKANIRNVMTKILIIRIALNSLHIFLDPAKMKDIVATAKKLAAVVSPPIAVFLIPLVTFLIVISWAAAESVIDLKLLMRGESVPIFKTRKDWILSAEGGLEKLKEKITGTLVEVGKEYVKDMIDEKIDSLENSAKKYIENIKDSINTKVDNIVEKIFEPVEAALNSADKTIKDNYAYITESLENELSNIANGEMNTIVKEIYRIAQEEYKKAKEEIQNKVTMPIDKAREEIDNIKESIKDSVSEKISGLEETINKKISEFAKEGKEKLNEYIDSFGNKNSSDIGDYNNVKASAVSFNYEEYLRLLLLTMDRDKKITRIQDLIQLQMMKMTGNKEFKLAHCNTYIGVKVDVSMKYFFMTQPFVKKELQTEEFDRHSLKVMLFKGY
ncbi:DUF5702 domain-containing protein [Acetivibrio clariflavus]|uniref:DUF5702 domain-containing protein n=1 Tax=Acetivibrio clariflavus TaxID=288965 RepID=UPI00047F5B9D|nr:DUF5702 domain-containing protein [Acetivibrio clariflavus]